MDSDRLWGSRIPRAGMASVRLLVVALLTACVGLAGCSGTRLNQPARAVSLSLAPVVDQSAMAYREAVALHNLREDYEAVVAYENKDASYNPRTVPVLLSEK